MTQHFTERYGKEEVKTWYFEVWNEPNLKYFYSSTKDEYFKLYDYSARAVKSVSKDYRVGGPATAGKEGSNAAFIDKGIVLQSDSADSWEGLQGTDSFYPYLVDNKWYAFYGSAKTEKMPIEHWLVGLAQSKCSSIAGPWKRCSERNPSTIEKTFIENPIVTKISSGYIVIYDNLTADSMGWAYSKDGINWGEGQSLIIQPNAGKWSEDVRTVLGLVDEGNGNYTVFYTGFEQAPDWGRLLTGIGKETCAVGFVELQIVEKNQ